MITDSPSRHRSISSRLARAALTLIIIAMGWFATMAAAMLVIDKPAAVMVIVRDIDAVRSLAPDIKLVRGGNHVFIMTGSRPGYVRQIYKSGAWLVLPSLPNGCLSLTKMAR